MCREEVVISGWTDRVYLGGGGSLVEVEGAEGGSLQLTSANLPDTVIWNPWQEKVGHRSGSFRAVDPHSLLADPDPALKTV